MTDTDITTIADEYIKACDAYADAKFYDLIHGQASASTAQALWHRDVAFESLKTAVLKWRNDD